MRYRLITTLPVALLLLGFTSLTGLACLRSARMKPLPLARPLGGADSGAVIMRVSETTITKVVGVAAVQDCKLAFELGWKSCATLADRCTTLVLEVNGAAIIVFDPDKCFEDIDQGLWMLSAPETDKISLFPVRDADDPPLVITPRP